MTGGPPPARHPELAGHARRRAARAGLPDRGPARLGGSPRPLHDPGAHAAGRDRQRAAGAAGRPQGPDPRPARADPGRRDARARASADLVRQLNAQLEQARIAAGLIPLTGTGIVLQLEDSQAAGPARRQTSRDYLVGSRDIRAVVEELWAAGRRGDRGQRRADHRRPRRSSTSGRRCWSTRPTWRRRTRSPRSARPTCTTGSARRPGFVDFVRPAREGYGIRVSLAEPESVDMPAFVGTVTLRYSRPIASPPPVAPSAGARAAGRLTMHAPSQPAHDRGGRVHPRPARRRPAPVAGRRRGPRPAVVAGPDRPRGQPQRPQRPAPARGRRRSSASWRRSSANRSRGDVSVDEITRRPRARPRLRRARPGRRARASTISVGGPIDGPGVEELDQRAAQRRRRGDRDRTASGS